MSRGFLFIVNELPTNDDLETIGSVDPRYRDGNWRPPVLTQGFFAQEPGYVFRWKNEEVSPAHGYYWSAAHQGICANTTTGTLIWPELYRVATVFWCDDDSRFVSIPIDASAQNLDEWDQGFRWQRLLFNHQGNISQAGHTGEEDHLVVRKSSWIPQLLPKNYRCRRDNGPSTGGLAGLLPIIIALVAFSCPDRDELYRVLIHDEAWRGHSWTPHGRESGRRPRRGLVVSVYLDPENPRGSNLDELNNMEYGTTPIFR